MSRQLRKYSFAFMLLAGFSQLSHAQIQETIGPSAFSIDSIAVNSAPLPMVGDTIHLLLWVRANVTGPAILHLQFPGNIAPPDQSPGETDLDSTLPIVDSGIRIFPNPARNTVTVLGQIIEPLSLYDEDGRFLEVLKLRQGQFLLNDLLPGSYYLRSGSAITRFNKIP